MVTSGLHPLDCMQCGAPINPPAESTVVRCGHCGRPHMWVAPGTGERGQWVAQQAPVRSRGSMRWLLVVPAIVALMVVIGAISAVFLRRVAPRQPSREVVTPNMPLQSGDRVTYFRTPNDSCIGFVAALLANSRVLVAGCGAGDNGVPADRSMLTLDSYDAFRSPEPDDVALEQTTTGWMRVVVIAPEPGERVRVEPLLGGAEHGAPAASLRVVWQGRDSSVSRWIPLPDGAPLENGDVVYFRNGGMIDSGKVTRLDGSDIELLKGFAGNDGFTPDKNAAPARRARSTVLVTLGSPQSPPTGSKLLLAQKDGKWLRATLVSTGEHGRWTVRAAGGGDPWVVWGRYVPTLLHV